MFCGQVFFAATIPFVFVLVVGLVGISRINEQIERVPMLVTQSGAFEPADCAAFCSCFKELQIGLQVYGVAVTKQRVLATVATLLATLLAKTASKALAE